MVAPFVSGIYAGDADKLSVQAAFPRLSNLEMSYGGLFRGTFAKAREARKAKKAARDVLDKAAPTRRRLISFKDGMSVLPQTIAARLGEDVFTGCKDIRARAGVEGNGFEVEFERGGAGERFSCGQLVIATPARPAAALVSPFNDELSRLLDEIYYPPLSIVCLSYDVAAVSRPLDGFGFLVAPGEPLSILGCVWNSSLFKGRAPAGKALLTVFIGGARMPDLARVGDAELVSTAHGDLQKVLGISQEARPVSITRWERAIPQYLIGHRARVRRIEEILHGTGGLRLIGNYLHGVSTGDCVKEADRHAREIWDSLSPGP
jgi:oxygen-dependent protoporphyrinogen oxidase